jgi:hypothetical protein
VFAFFGQSAQQHPHRRNGEQNQVFQVREVGLHAHRTQWVISCCQKGLVDLVVPRHPQLREHILHLNESFRFDPKGLMRYQMVEQGREDLQRLLFVDQEVSHLESVPRPKDVRHTLPHV